MSSIALFALVLLAPISVPQGPPEGMHRAQFSDFDFASVNTGPCTWVGFRPPDPAYAQECKRMSEPQYFRGVWRVEFEMSDFAFAGRKDCYEARDDSCITLEGAVLPWPPKETCLSRRYEVEFVGRRSILPGPHASTPMYKVVAERLITAKRILPDRKDPACGE